MIIVVLLTALLVSIRSELQMMGATQYRIWILRNVAKEAVIFGHHGLDWLPHADGANGIRSRTPN